MEIITPTKTLKTYDSKKWRILELMSSSVYHELHDDFTRFSFIFITSDEVCSRDYIDVGDGCLRQNVFMTSLRCYWPIGKITNTHNEKKSPT